MAEDRPLEGLDQSEIFRGVMADEAPKEAPVEATVTTTEPLPSAPSLEAPAEAEKEVIPSWRLREESENRRAAEERARQLEERLNQITSHLRQAAGEKKTPDFFEDPQAAIDAAIIRVLGPFAEETRQNLMGFSKAIAEQVHGDKVDKAEKAFLTAMNNGTLDPHDYERVVQASNRYNEVVKWHERAQTFETVGTDANAWFDKKLKERLKDQTFAAELLEAIRGEAGGRPGKTRLPPSLSSMTSAASNKGAVAIGDLSNESLWEASKPEQR